jgi:hypothetical protein
MKTKLDQVVREFMIESLGASQTDSRFARLYQIAVSGMAEINSDVGHNSHVVKLNLRDNNTASLPSDYIDWYKVGVCVGNDILGFAVNEDPCPISLNVDDCGQIKKRPSTSDNQRRVDNHLYLPSVFESYNKDGQFVGRKHGLRGGRPVFGSFQIDENQGYIYIESDFVNHDGESSEIVLEYMTTLPKDERGNILVHPYEKEAIKAWMWWKYVQRQRSYNIGDKEDARQTYGREKKKARKRINAMTVAEVVAAVRKGYGAAPGI